MAINRVKSPYASGYFGPLYGPAAFAIDGGDISTFVATSSNPNNVVGATYKVHKWLSTGTFTVTFTKAGYIDLLVIGGGGSGGRSYGGVAGAGGGAGGLIQKYGYGVLAGNYTITVGAGGQGRSSNSINNGQNSSFGPLIAYGGGSGGGYYGNDQQPGGSGGGEGEAKGGGAAAIDINQGNPGRLHGTGDNAGGGGGAGSGGGTSTSGGDPLLVAFDSNVGVYYCGGGNGYSNVIANTNGGGGGISSSGSGHGGNAYFYGGGGGGAYRGDTNWYYGGNGYQGLVMVRYRIS